MRHPRRTLGACTLALFVLSGGAGRMAHAQGPSSAGARPAVTRIVDRACSDTVGRRAPVPTPDRTAPVLTWRDGPPSWAEWPVQLGAARVAVTVIIARFDPTRIALSLDIVRAGDRLGAWSISRATDSAVVAFNAGQFDDDGPWGWVVHRGREWQPRGFGSLAADISVDSTGRVRIMNAAEAVRGGASPSPGTLPREALQSYPRLLVAGRLAAPLCRPGTINRAHRDIRLALGVRHDGEVLVVLTRYAPPAIMPSVASRLPIGPTTLEMAEIMHRLGAVDAVMLDGGLSAQLRVGRGVLTRSWPGLRDVPLGLVGFLRQ